MKLGSKIVIFFALSSLLFSSCGKEDNNEENNGDVYNGDNINPETGFASSSSGGSMQLQMVSTGGISNSSSLNLLDAAIDKYYHSRTVVAGAPEEFVIFVTNLSLSNSDGSGEVPIFSFPEGKPLRIEGTTVDMSQFFTEIKCMDEDGNVLDAECLCGADEDGEPIAMEDVLDDNGNSTGEQSCPMLEDGQTPPVALVPVSQEGTFDTLKLSLLGQADVKGCVGNYIRQDGYGEDDVENGGEEPHYTDNVEFENYCTRKKYSMETALDGTAAESSKFLATTNDAQWTSARFSMDPDHGDSFNMEFPIKDTITIAADSEDKPNITMVVDTSRVLRFFKRDNYEDRARPDGGPEAEAFKGSYFYINRFGSQNFVFVGRPGTIQGYRYRADSSRTEDDLTIEPPTTVTDGSEYQMCTREADDCFDYGGGWVTMVFDPDGEPMLISIQPDDNNSGIKYANQSRDGIDPSVISETSSGVYKVDAEFEDGGGNPWIVKMYNIDTTIDIGESVDSYFYQYLESGEEGDFSETWGVMHLERAL